MKKLKLTLFTVIVMMSLYSCQMGDLTSDASGFVKIEEMFNKKFGEGAYYTNISIIPDNTVGTLINTTVTNNPGSLKMEEWTRLKGVWELKSNVTLEITGGEAEEFMFTFKKASIKKIGELMEDAIKRLKDEKNIDGVLKIASIIAPDDADWDKFTYYISLEPENGGTSFSFFYDIDGNFISMNY